MPTNVIYLINVSISITNIIFIRWQKQPTWSVEMGVTRDEIVNAAAYQLSSTGILTPRNVWTESYTIVMVYQIPKKCYVNQL
jgi:hypothetical protein